MAHLAALLQIQRKTLPGDSSECHLHPVSTFVMQAQEQANFARLCEQSRTGLRQKAHDAEAFGSC